MLDLSECIRVLVALALSIGADLSELNSICNSNPTCQREIEIWLERDHDNDQQTLQSLAASTIESSEVNQCRLTAQ